MAALVRALRTPRPAASFAVKAERARVRLALDRAVEAVLRVRLRQAGEAVELDPEERVEGPLGARPEELPIRLGRAERRRTSSRELENQGVLEHRAERLEPPVAGDEAPAYGVERLPGRRPVGHAEEAALAPGNLLPPDAHEARVRTGRMRLAPGLVDGRRRDRRGARHEVSPRPDVQEARILEDDAPLDRAARDVDTEPRALDERALVLAVEIVAVLAAQPHLHQRRDLPVPDGERLRRGGRDLRAGGPRPRPRDEPHGQAEAPHRREASISRALLRGG